MEILNYLSNLYLILFICIVLWRKTKILILSNILLFKVTRISKDGQKYSLQLYRDLQREGVMSFVSPETVLKDLKLVAIFICISID